MVDPQAPPLSVRLKQLFERIQLRIEISGKKYVALGFDTNIKKLNV